jgi:hypothetical protein
MVLAFAGPPCRLIRTYAAIFVRYVSYATDKLKIAFDPKLTIATDRYC